MSNSELRTVGEVAELLGVSVRTLHHWESRGLVSPQQRSWSNYRLYSNDDVARLQKVLIYRATGMALDEIATVLETDKNHIALLRRQRQVLMKQQTELRHMLEAIERLLEEEMNNKKLSVEEVAQILGDTQFPIHQAEAEEQYAGTDDWEHYAAKTATMTAEDWQKIRQQTADVEVKLVEGMKSGLLPGSDQANTLAELHRELLSTYFPVTHSKHVIIAAGYVADPRFHAYYEDRAEGLAQWLKAIIDANAQARGVDLSQVTWD